MKNELAPFHAPNQLKMRMHTIILKWKSISFFAIALCKALPFPYRTWMASDRQLRVVNVSTGCLRWWNREWKKAAKLFRPKIHIHNVNLWDFHYIQMNAEGAESNGAAWKEREFIPMCQNQTLIESYFNKNSKQLLRAYEILLFYRPVEWVWLGPRIFKSGNGDRQMRAPS